MAGVDSRIGHRVAVEEAGGGLACDPRLSRRSDHAITHENIVEWVTVKPTTSG